MSCEGGGGRCSTYSETSDLEDADKERSPLRLPVQWICRPHLDFRGYAGTLTSGRIVAGDPVVVLPSGRRSRIASVISAEQGQAAAGAGEPVVVTLADELDVSRGDMICGAKDPIEVADRLSAKVVWLGEQQMLRGRSYELRLGPQSVLAQIGACKYKIDVEDLRQVPTRTLGFNEVGVCELALDRQIAFEPYAMSRENGGFILIDRLTNATVGAGMIDFALRRSHNIHWQSVDIDKSARASLKSQQPCCIWFTGLSGSGKSTVANATSRKTQRTRWVCIPICSTATMLGTGSIATWALPRSTALKTYPPGVGGSSINGRRRTSSPWYRSSRRSLAERPKRP